MDFIKVINNFATMAVIVDGLVKRRLLKCHLLYNILIIKGKIIS